MEDEIELIPIHTRDRLVSGSERTTSATATTQGEGVPAERYDEAEVPRRERVAEEDPVSGSSVLSYDRSEKEKTPAPISEDQDVVKSATSSGQATELHPQSSPTDHDSKTNDQCPVAPDRSEGMDESTSTDREATSKGSSVDGLATTTSTACCDSKCLTISPVAVLDSGNLLVPCQPGTNDERCSLVCIPSPVLVSPSLNPMISPQTRRVSIDGAGNAASAFLCYDVIGVIVDYLEGWEQSTVRLVCHQWKEVVDENASAYATEEDVARLVRRHNIEVESVRENEIEMPMARFRLSLMVLLGCLALVLFDTFVKPRDSGFEIYALIVTVTSFLEVVIKMCGQRIPDETGCTRRFSIRWIEMSWCVMPLLAAVVVFLRDPAQTEQYLLQHRTAVAECYFYQVPPNWPKDPAEVVFLRPDLWEQENEFIAHGEDDDSIRFYRPMTISASFDEREIDCKAALRDPLGYAAKFRRWPYSRYPTSLQETNLSLSLNSTLSPRNSSQEAEVNRTSLRTRRYGIGWFGYESWPWGNSSNPVVLQTLRTATWYSTTKLRDADRDWRLTFWWTERGETCVLNVPGPWASKNITPIYHNILSIYFLATFAFLLLASEHVLNIYVTREREIVLGVEEGRSWKTLLRTSPTTTTLRLLRRREANRLVREARLGSVFGGVRGNRRRTFNLLV
jgi:hypothetical protein